jgi:hypothetical protein
MVYEWGIRPGTIRELFNVNAKLLNKCDAAGIRCIPATLRLQSAHGLQWSKAVSFGHSVTTWGVVPGAHAWRCPRKWRMGRETVVPVIGVDSRSFGGPPLRRHCSPALDRTVPTFAFQVLDVGKTCTR